MMHAEIIARIEQDARAVAVRKSVITTARREIGPGRPAVYWKAVLEDPIPPFPPHWCAALALWCLHQNGCALDVRFKRSWGFLGDPKTKKWRVPTTKEPREGDVAYFTSKQHHALVISLEKATPLLHNGFALPRWKLWTVDGNQPDCRERCRDYVPALGATVSFFSIAPWIGKVIGANE